MENNGVSTNAANSVRSSTSNDSFTDDVIKFVNENYERSSALIDKTLNLERDVKHEVDRTDKKRIYMQRLIEKEENEREHYNKLMQKNRSISITLQMDLEQISSKHFEMTPKVELLSERYDKNVDYIEELMVAMDSVVNENFDVIDDTYLKEMREELLNLGAKAQDCMKQFFELKKDFDSVLAFEREVFENNTKNEIKVLRDKWTEKKDLFSTSVADLEKMKDVEKALNFDLTIQATKPKLANILQFDDKLSCFSEGTVSLRNDISRYMRDIEITTDEIDEMLKCAEQQIIESERFCKELELQRTSRTGKIKSILDELFELHENNAKVQKDFELRTENMNQLRKNEEMLRATIAEKAAKLADCQLNINELVALENQLQEKIKEEKAKINGEELKTIQEKCGQLESQISDCKDELVAINNVVDMLKKASDRLLSETNTSKNMAENFAHELLQMMNIENELSAASEEENLEELRNKVEENKQVADDLNDNIEEKQLMALASEEMEIHSKKMAEEAAKNHQSALMRKEKAISELDRVTVEMKNATSELSNVTNLFASLKRNSFKVDGVPVELTNEIESLLHQKNISKGFQASLAKKITTLSSSLDLEIKKETDLEIRLSRLNAASTADLDAASTTSKLLKRSYLSQSSAGSNRTGFATDKPRASAPSPARSNVTQFSARSEINQDSKTKRSYLSGTPPTTKPSLRIEDTPRVSVPSFDSSSGRRQMQRNQKTAKK